jgi:hypothetical protein
MIEKCKCGSEVPSWLIDLSVKGPFSFLKNAQPDYPRPGSLTFIDSFRAMVEATDPDDDQSIGRFAKWVSIAAMGENLDLPEVMIGYRIDDAYSFKGGDPLAIARETVRCYRPGCQEIAMTLEQSN